MYITNIKKEYGLIEKSNRMHDVEQTTIEKKWVTNAFKEINEKQNKKKGLTYFRLKEKRKVELKKKMKIKNFQSLKKTNGSRKLI